MSMKRRDIHQAKLRRDRLKRERQQIMAPPPEPAHPFASERSMREIDALMEGHKFKSIEEFNDRLAKLSGSGRVSEMAQARKEHDAKWRAQELAYEALETDSIEEALYLVNEALKLDPDCTDAERLMVSLLPAEPDNRLHLMRQVVEKAERNLGEAFFEEHMGHFWGVLPTRPYMRAKQHLAELCVENGRLDEGIATYERMLELNPGDNQGMRYTLLGLYLAAGRAEAAERLMAAYPDEQDLTAVWHWARIMLAWLAGNEDEAKAALGKAREMNPFVERYLSGARPLPGVQPAAYRPGEDSEAQIWAHELALAMKTHPAFRDWLRAQR